MNFRKYYPEEIFSQNTLEIESECSGAHWQVLEWSALKAQLKVTAMNGQAIQEYELRFND